MRKYFFNYLIFLLASTLLLINCHIAKEQERRFIKPAPYERQKWFAFDQGLGRETEWEFRPKMARDLVIRNILMGKSRAKIIEMLGEDGDTGLYAPNKIRYDLQSIYGSNIDPIAHERLIVTFNQENKVEKAEIKFDKTHDW